MVSPQSQVEVDGEYADYFDQLMASRQDRIQLGCALHAKAVAGTKAFLFHLKISYFYEFFVLPSFFLGLVQERTAIILKYFFIFRKYCSYFVYFVLI